MNIEHFYDKSTQTLTWLVSDPATGDAVVIDPVLDYDPVGSKITTKALDRVLAAITAQNLRLHWILETHAHADHLSGAQRLKDHHPGAQVAIGRRIIEVQEVFKRVFDLPDDFITDGRQFDVLLEDEQIVEAGSVQLEVRFTPGHTPACCCYVMRDPKNGDAVFTGDTLFLPDVGTGRCDFPAGSADDLYRSVTERIYTLPDDTRLCVGHDYPPDGRPLPERPTVGDSKAHNIQLPAALDRATFVQRRNARDATLRAPRLLYQSVQVNIDAGHLPEAGRTTVRYLKIPLNGAAAAAT